MAFSCGFVTFSCHFVGKGKARDKLQKLNSVELIVRFGRLSVVAFEIGCVFFAYLFLGILVLKYRLLSYYFVFMLIVFSPNLAITDLT